MLALNLCVILTFYCTRTRKFHSLELTSALSRCARPRSGKAFHSIRGRMQRDRALVSSIHSRLSQNLTFEIENVSPSTFLAITY
jgi:hypothetical protein